MSIHLIGDSEDELLKLRLFPDDIPIDCCTLFITGEFHPSSSNNEKSG